MPTPVDATQTEAWKKLSQLHSELNVDFREWFAADPERTRKFSFSAGDLFVDLSKSVLTDGIKKALEELAFR